MTSYVKWRGICCATPFVRKRAAKFYFGGTEFYCLRSWDARNSAAILWAAGPGCWREPLSPASGSSRKSQLKSPDSAR